MAVPFSIRPLEARDLPGVVAIHRSGLPDDPLASLGRRYLARHFHPAAHAHPWGRTFVAETSSGTLLGFHLCCRRSARFREEVFASTRGALLRALLVRPRVWPHVAAQLADRHPPPPWADEPEIFLLATDPATSPTSPLCARALLNAGWDWLRSEGERTCVCHIEPDNVRTQRLARGMRMVEVGLERRGRRKFLVFRRQL